MSDVGEGWRRLEVGEQIEAGDEYRGFHGNWYGTARAGTPVTARDDTFRRRVPAATADAPTPAPHTWCRDLPRDLAARADEQRDDTVLHRDLPEAIHRLNGLVAGLAERLAEMERRHNGLAELAKLDAGWNRVRDAATAAQDIERITAERDAAIRERDEARAEKAADWKAACDSALAASNEIGRLKARVAELEAASEAGTVRVDVIVRLNPFNAVVWDRSQSAPVWSTRFVTLDLTPAQVADIERQVSGEVVRG